MKNCSWLWGRWGVPYRPSSARLPVYTLLVCLLAGLVAGCTVGECRAGWGSGGCAPVGAPFLFGQVPQSYEWRDVPDRPDERALYLGGFHVGSYDTVNRYYRRWVGNDWGAIGDCPIAPPMARRTAKAPPLETKKVPKPCSCCEDCGCTHCLCDAGKRCCDGCECRILGKTGDMPQWMTSGVITAKVGQDGESYQVNGRQVTQAEAEKAIGGPGGKEVPNDAGLLRMTVIGADADRQRVMADLAGPVLGPLRDKILVQDYLPTHWAVAQAGFVTTGTPTIYLQAPDGKVLHRQDNYEGPDKLAEAVRRADPNYKPHADPDLSVQPAPLLPTNINLAAIPPIGWVGIIGGLGFLFAYIKRAK